jgi:hypothetical protein
VLSIDGGVGTGLALILTRRRKNRMRVPQARQDNKIAGIM